jgi:two-component system OmpR family response regulator
MRALLVEDDLHLARALQLTLEQDGFAVDTAGTVEGGRVSAMSSDFDVIVLDLILPDGHGTSLIQRLRHAGRDTPIMVLTGNADERATILALDAGADDYLTKPVALEIFRARVRALVRRGGAKRTEHLAVANVVLNRLTREALINGAPLTLTPRELSLLEHFLIKPESVITRLELLSKVFGLRIDPGTNVLDVAISRLRRKLLAAHAGVAIVSRRGIGFALTTIGSGTIS